MDSGLMKLNTSRIVSSTVVLFLTACSTQPVEFANTAAPLLNPDAAYLLSADVSQTLSASMLDVALLIPAGLNQGKHLAAGPTYFAASGRLCRKVVLSDHDVKKNHIACKTKSTIWELKRAAI